MEKLIYLVDSVENPVKIAVNSGVDSRHSFGSTQSGSKGNHSYCEDEYSVNFKTRNTPY